MAITKEQVNKLLQEFLSQHQEEKAFRLPMEEVVALYESDLYFSILENLIANHAFTLATIIPQADVNMVLPKSLLIAIRIGQRLEQELMLQALEATLHE